MASERLPRPVDTVLVAPLARDELHEQLPAGRCRGEEAGGAGGIRLAQGHHRRGTKPGGGEGPADPGGRGPPAGCAEQQVDKRARRPRYGLATEASATATAAWPDT